MRLRSENSRLNSGGASSPSTFLINDKAEKNTTELKRELLGSLLHTLGHPGHSMGPFSNAGAKVRILFENS